jgi:hypothetical protein
VLRHTIVAIHRLVEQGFLLPWWPAGGAQSDGYGRSAVEIVVSQDARPRPLCVSEVPYAMSRTTSSEHSA